MVSPLVTLFALTLVAAPAAMTPLPLPGGDGPVGFDDLRFSPELHAVLVPAGRTGRVDLVDPRTRAVVEIPGFATSRGGDHGHGESTTSAETGAGFLFASDRTEREVVAADPGSRRILARAKLEGGPDYVRWVGPTREVWVTEPGRKRIEIFRVGAGSPPVLARAGAIEVPDGPESLEIDPGRHRAYTNTWHDSTIAIDVRSRAIVARWKNGCGGARGLALDVARGFLFVGCDEGRAVVLDAGHDGAVLGEARAGEGVDVLAYAPGLSHLYVPGGQAQDLRAEDAASSGCAAGSATRYLVRTSTWVQSTWRASSSPAPPTASAGPRPTPSSPRGIASSCTRAPSTDSPPFVTCWPGEPTPSPGTSPTSSRSVAWPTR